MWPTLFQRTQHLSCSLDGSPRALTTSLVIALPGFRQFCQSFARIGRDYWWVYNYDETVSNTLDNEANIIDMTGSDGQEDECLESAISASHAIGKNVAGCRERFRLRFVMAITEFEATHIRLTVPDLKDARKTCIMGDYGNLPTPTDRLFISAKVLRF